MFKIIACAALLLPVLLACEKDMKSSFEPGVYKGSFKRTGPGYPGSESSSVVLNFDGHLFSGSSSQPFFPAIGTGKYMLLNDNIIFENESAFTANFDWSLILDESFSKNYSGYSIVLIKGHGDMVLYHDVYTLKKQ